MSLSDQFVRRDTYPPSLEGVFRASDTESRIAGLMTLYRLIDSLPFAGIKPESFDNSASPVANVTPGQVQSQAILGSGEYHGGFTLRVAVQPES